MKNKNSTACISDNAPNEKRYSDVFHASDLARTTLARPYDLPSFPQSLAIPEKVISFDKAISPSDALDFSCYVHFYIQDVTFERFWTNPAKFIPLLKRFAGCICPDFSLYYDMPYPQQLFNCYRNRLLGSIMADAGIDVIMNVSFGDSRTLDFCTCGIERGSVLASGSLGTMKNVDERAIFHEGLQHILSVTKPSDLLIYGTATTETFELCKQYGAKLHIYRPKWDGSFITRRCDYGQR